MGSCLLKNCTGTKQEDQCSNILAWFAFTFMVVTAVTVLFNIVIIAPQTLEPVSFGFIAPMACGFLSLVFYVGATRDCRWQTLFLVLTILVMVGVSVATPALTSNNILNANALTAVTGVGAVVGASAVLEFNSKHMEGAEPLLEKETAPKLLESNYSAAAWSHIQFSLAVCNRTIKDDNETSTLFPSKKLRKKYKKSWKKQKDTEEYKATKNAIMEQVFNNSKVFQSKAKSTINNKNQDAQNYKNDVIVRTHVENVYDHTMENGQDIKYLMEQLQCNIGTKSIARRLLGMMR